MFWFMVVFWSAVQSKAGFPLLSSSTGEGEDLQPTQGAACPVL